MTIQRTLHATHSATEFLKVQFPISVGIGGVKQLVGRPEALSQPFPEGRHLGVHFVSNNFWLLKTRSGPI